MARRFVAVCHMGICRSGALVLALRQKNQDAVAISAYLGSAELRQMLFSWADYIIVMQPKFADVIPAELRSKTRVVDVGEDRWSNPTHPELLGYCATIR